MLLLIEMSSKGDIEMMGHHMDDTDRMSYNAVASQEDVEKNEIVEGYVECKKCGDHVMKEFLGRHMRMIHGEDGPVAITPLKQSSPRPRNIIMRACPECGVEMRSDSITKHCKLKHKVSYRYCSACAKYIRKKEFKPHVKKHETGKLTGDVAPEEDDNELDTSKDEDDDELIIAEEAESPEIYTKKISSPKKFTTVWTAPGCSCRQRRMPITFGMSMEVKVEVLFLSCQRRKQLRRKLTMRRIWKRKTRLMMS